MSEKPPLIQTRRRRWPLVAGLCAVVLMLVGVGVAVVVWSGHPAVRTIFAGASSSASPSGSPRPSPSRTGMAVAGPLPTGSPVCNARLGFIGALTGPVGPFGTSIHRGAQLAVDEYNRAHPGCAVTLADCDSQSDPDRVSVLAAAASADQRLVGVIGTILSGESNAAMPILNRAGLTAITPTATATNLSANGWRVFHRAIANDAGQASAAARYITHELHATRVFVVNDGSAYGSAGAAVVRRGLAGAVAGSDQVQQGQQHFPGTINKIKTSGATAVYYGGYAAEAGALLSDLRAAGVTATFIGGDAINDSAFFDAAGGQNAEGAVSTCSCLPSSDQRFESAYGAAYHSAPGLFSGTAYDVASIFLVGLAHGVGTRADMLAFVNSFDGTGISGDYKFTAAGELDPGRSTVAIYVVHGGKFSYERTESAQ